MTSLAYAEGEAAPPRDNGELVFTAPWEAQAFAMTIALEDAGLIDPEDFRQRLIDAIAHWESLPSESRGEWSYYERWLHALQSVLLARGIIGDRELHDRIAELARVDDHGHDHDHDHHHAA